MVSGRRVFGDTFTALSAAPRFTSLLGEGRGTLVRLAMVITWPTRIRIFPT